MAVFFVIFLIFLLLVQKYSLRTALHRVYYDCEPSRHLIDPDESFTVHSTIENQKPMPVLFVRMIEKFPLDIQLRADESDIYRGTNRVELSSRFYLMPKQVYHREVEAKLSRRGCHFFSGCTMYGGDFMGMKETVEYYRGLKEVIVMPKSVDCPSLDKTLGDYLGDMSVNRFILEDPVLTIGFRDYTGREPQRAISWVQSARFGKMMVKNYDHTFDLSVTILLNVKTPYRTEENDALIEDCFCLVRAVCEKMEEKQVKYSFSTNAAISGFAGNWAEIGEGLGGNHFLTVMEGLGRATSSATQSFSLTIDRASRQAEQGRSFILVTPSVEEEWMPSLRRLQELSGAPVCILTPDLLREKKESEIA